MYLSRYIIMKTSKHENFIIIYFEEGRQSIQASRDRIAIWDLESAVYQVKCHELWRCPSKSHRVQQNMVEFLEDMVHGPKAREKEPVAKLEAVLLL